MIYSLNARTNKGEVINMKQKKLVKQIYHQISNIEYHFQSHGVKIKLEPHTIVGGGKRFIFHVQVLPGTRIKSIMDRASDVGTALGIPLFQPFQDGTSVFLAVSMEPMTENSLPAMLASVEFQQSNMQLPVALGYDLIGRMHFFDLARTPHALYVGATNSGKSVGMICLISSLLANLSPSEVNLVIFDVGANSMDDFCDLPHLSHPIVKDVETGIEVVHALATEMERRVSLPSDEVHKLPAIVCVVDEFISFISDIDNRVQRQDVINGFNGLLRRGRKANIHMVLATQDPKQKTMLVDIGNITTRMAFKCARFQTSIAVLNHSGAEELPGEGSMFYITEGLKSPLYIQGAYATPQQIEQWMEEVRATDFDLSNKFVISETVVDDIFILPSVKPSSTTLQASEAHKELAKIILWVLGQEQMSARQIKAAFSIGNRADNIMKTLCKMGVVSEKFANQPRQVLPKAVEDIPQEVVNFLTSNGVSMEEIAGQFTNGLNKISGGQEG